MTWVVGEEVDLATGLQDAELSDERNFMGYIPGVMLAGYVDWAFSIACVS